MIDVAALRPRLFGIAYRILGTIGDAEDVVQDAYIRWEERGGEAVRDVPAWLATVTARLAIDRGRTLARRRETYVGEWLPEPLIERDPADEVDVADDLTIGFLRVLERLGPDERTALLLHDAFDYSHAEVAVMLDKSEDAVRQDGRLAPATASMRNGRVLCSIGGRLRPPRNASSRPSATPMSTACVPYSRKTSYKLPTAAAASTRDVCPWSASTTYHAC